MAKEASQLCKVCKKKFKKNTFVLFSAIFALTTQMSYIQNNFSKVMHTQELEEILWKKRV